ncbi:MAG: twin-arginine translocase TatA/TatE family subunit [Methylococcales bacterium]|nr:twin-arginine translocase TatA/TatE family subunit [Methylococcales bacterium]
MGIGIKELLVVLVIAMVVFGTKKLGNVGADLGKAIKGFRSAIKDGEADNKAPEAEDEPLEGVVTSKKNEKL